MPITTRTSVLMKSPGRFETIELELDDPRQGEVMVKMAASGLCHSDDHLATGDFAMANRFPYAGGHEGAGVITAVGPNTPGFEEGDHVVFSFVAACGRCEFCARGLSNLCDRGALILSGSRPDDPSSFRMSYQGKDVPQMCGLGTFSEYTTVSVESVVKIPKDIPLVTAALVGCGVTTGWGSATKSAGIEAGDTVIVMGVGGLGTAAVQGALHAGAMNVVAVDPVSFKRESALQFGATHAYETMEEATDFARSVTNGQGADATIITVGVMKGEYLAQGMSSIRKAGTVVVTGMGNLMEVGAPISLADLTLMQKRIQGTIFGHCNPKRDIPLLLRMYQAGQLKLDEMITRRYTLDQVAESYDDMHAGENIRGVVVFDD